MFRCACDCGNEKNVRLCNLRTSTTTSCGCFKDKLHSRRLTTHGDTKNRHPTVEYNTWCNIRRRCSDPSHQDYYLYGGRGIKVCRAWTGRMGYTHFLHDLGRRPSPKHSIDRINVNGDYKPHNTRWVLLKQQQRNKRNNHIVRYGGTNRCIAEWSDIVGISQGALWYRLNNPRWSVHKSLTTPVLCRTK